MKLGYLLLLILSIPLQAKTYYFYPEQLSANEISKLKMQLNGKDIFTPLEQNLLQNTIVNKSVFKFNSDKDLPALQKLCQQCVIEAETYGQFQSQNPADPYFNLQWALHNNGDPLNIFISDIDVKTYFALAGEDIQLPTGPVSQRIRVAVLDGGVDIQHIDLNANIAHKQVECEAQKKYDECLNTEKDKNICHQKWAKFDGDGNGYPRDCHGWNITGSIDELTGLDGNNRITDRNGHGTHVAGIIGASWNRFGTRGALSQVDILPIQISASSSSDAESGTATDVFAKGILYAIQAKAQVINISLGWKIHQDSMLMRQMIAQAVEQNILIVAAGGNSAHDGATYPCYYPEVICVAAHGPDGKLASFSNFGTGIDIAAPGLHILSTYPMHKRSITFTDFNGLEYLDGTSQAAPYVSAGLAYLLGTGSTPDEARVKLLSGARANKNKFIRHGNLDIKNAFATSPSSFLYPLTKGDLLVNWEKEKRTLSFKLKNYLKQNDQVKLTLTSDDENIQLALTEKTFSKIEKDEIIEWQTEVLASEDAPKDFTLNVHIQSLTENKTYKLNGSFVNVILDDYPTEKYTINSPAPLKNFEFIPIKSITSNTEDEFLLYSSRNEKTLFGMTKKVNDHFATFKFHSIDMANPLVLDVSKVDLEQNGNPKYVITYIDIYAPRAERFTYFMVLDENFETTDILINPENKFDNNLTVMPGSFQWLKYKKRLVPSWVGSGQIATLAEVIESPWENPRPKTTESHFYQLTPMGLYSYPLSKNETASFLSYQSELSKQAGSSYIVTATGIGFFKTYKQYLWNGSLKFVKEIKLNLFQNMQNLRPLPIFASEQLDGIIFHEQTASNRLFITSLYFEKDGHIVNQENWSMPQGENLRYLLQADYNSNTLFYLTQNKIGLFDGYQHHLLPTRVETDRIRYRYLPYSRGIYSTNTQGTDLISDLVIHKDNSIKRYAATSFIIPQCSEIGVISNTTQKEDYLYLYCDHLKQVKKINLSKIIQSF